MLTSMVYCHLSCTATGVLDSQHNLHEASILVGRDKQKKNYIEVYQVVLMQWKKK